MLPSSWSRSKGDKKEALVPLTKMAVTGVLFGKVRGVMKKAALWLVFVLLISLVLWTAGCPQKEELPTLTLGIRNVELCSAISDDGDYTVQPGATFERGDVVWLYFEVPGMTMKGVEGEFEYWGKFNELKIYDPNGDIIASAVDMGEIHETDVDEMPDFIWFYAWYETTTDDPAGQYTFELTVSDEFSGAIGTASANFTLK